MLTKPCNDTNTASNCSKFVTNAIWLCLPIFVYSLACLLVA